MSLGSYKDMELTATSADGTSTTTRARAAGRYPWTAGALPLHVGDRVEVTPTDAHVHVVPLGHAGTHTAPDAAVAEPDHT
ncbi:hypothetical protein SCATT_03010 [Streptantibioticus cattleyicolor NRRL 8057 = DSM 46488]|uniref:Uncharacterized protein n=1 Tax=Streptantibioticus cattleyicolor (strain ATCC 35852 / DSM 46488 / JCM 4925 / NBRC 14057 / NRRL 8057) TaxID=1003195 RepID=F8JNU2_STREN|nr:hypothetical protein SCATT_03010 [Streptantibioticus cattleyicolor NRRL 8057 = DSM 46488]MYS57442.1 hypothetical protein [Streptomyces sp. SID5468]CCB73029.1 protein of unknown function [Streptantibioticus cattleyicolor NRRL 8057 = DSM 46488]